MIPLGDVVPLRTVPYVTVALIAVNALVFLFELSLPDRDLNVLLQQRGVVPALLAAPTLLTGLFLHGGWVHLLGNELFLWVFGGSVEDRVGHVRFLAFYVLCGVAGAVMQVVVGPDSYVPIVGAGGAVAGVMGGYVMLYPHSQVLAVATLVVWWDLVEIPAYFFIGFWFLLQLLGGVGSIAITTSTAQVAGVAFWAYVLAFLAGASGIRAIRGPRYRTAAWWKLEP